MNQIRIVLVLISLALSGCTTMDSVMASWEGHNIDDLTASWGAPTSRMQRGDGGYTYTWSTFYANQYGGGECRQSFVTDSSRTVRRWSYSGCQKIIPK